MTAAQCPVDDAFHRTSTVCRRFRLLTVDRETEPFGDPFKRVTGGIIRTAQQRSELVPAHLCLVDDRRSVA